MWPSLNEWRPIKLLAVREKERNQNGRGKLKVVRRADSRAGKEMNWIQERDRIGYNVERYRKFKMRQPGRE